jgi:hypothetical protein
VIINKVCIPQRCGMHTLLRNARLPSFPPDMALPVQSVTLPIHYRLE